MKSEYKKGLLVVLLAHLVWGFLPIYWQTLRPIDSSVIILYRIVTMAIVCYFISCKIVGFKNVFKELIVSKKVFFTYLIAGILITANWSTYIWAVNANLVVDACLGYYIEPLVICAFGIAFFGEKVNKWKVISFIFAMSAILVLVIGYKQLPTISLALAFTFGTYAAIKKKVKIHPIQSMFYETLFVFPFALIALLYLEFTGQGAFQVAETHKTFLVFFSGFCTLVPLGLFSSAATKMPLMTLGVTGYLSPSISLILGIYLFNEPFELPKFIAFVVIWIGLVFFTIGEFREINKRKLEDVQLNER